MKYLNTPAAAAAIRAAAIRAAAELVLQPLERRVLLSSISDGGAFDIDKVSHFASSSGDLLDLKHGPMAKAGGTLAQLYSDYKKFTRKGGDPGDFVGKESLLKNMLMFGKDADGTPLIAVTLRAFTSVDDLKSIIASVGGRVLGNTQSLQAADAYVPIAALSALAGNGTIAHVNPIARPHAERGIAQNQGDRALSADSLRTAFGVTGAGQTVGVLSDSFSQIEGGYQDSITSGDLPKGVQVLDDTAFGGEDEGRGMSELIYDLAPGAKLAFATADNGLQSFAKNIIRLADAGAKTIVDDFGYLTESQFQNSVVSDAISEAKHTYGVSYYSSAGNEAQQAFEQQIHWVKAADGRMMVDFDPGPGVDTRMDLTFLGGGIDFQWDDPYNGVVGAPTVDLDIDFFDRQTGIKVFGGGDDNFATGVPNELFGTQFPDNYSMEIYVANRNGAKTLPTRFKLRSFSPIGLFEYPGINDATGGHNAAPDGNGVGAVPWFLAPNIQNRIGVNNEHFSSFGPVTQIFHSNGERMDKPITLLKPDFSSIDGVNTSFFPPGKLTDDPHDPDQLPNFFGTSAASPNAAAVSALLRSIVPTATPDEIKRSLIASTKDQPLNGSRAGTWNPQGGFGLINGLAAAHFLAPKHPIAQIATILPESQARPPKTIQIQFSERIDHFDKSDLILQRGSGGSNLLGSGAVKLTTNDNQTFFLKNLDRVASKPGRYILTVKGGTATATTGGDTTLGASASFGVSGKPTSVQAVPVSDSEVDLLWTDNTPNETRFKVYRAADPSFKQNLQVFNVSPNQTVFKDKGLESGFQYFYKVKAITPSSGDNPTSSSTSAITLSNDEVVVDNSNTRQTTIRGKWQHSVFGSGFVGGDYLISADPGASVTYTPDIPTSGNYFVYVRNIAASNRTTGAAVIVAGSGQTVNQQRGNGWKLLGAFKFDKGTGKGVTIRSSGSGITLADAVRFQLADTNAAKAQRRAGTSTTSVSSDTSRPSLFSQLDLGGGDDPFYSLS